MNEIEIFGYVAIHDPANDGGSAGLVVAGAGRTPGEAAQEAKLNCCLYSSIVGVKKSLYEEVEEDGDAPGLAAACQCEGLHVLA